MSTATLTAPSVKVTKADREQYGPIGKPILATKIYRAPFSNFSDPNVKAEKWVLVNEFNNTVTFANSYDGKLGEKYNLAVNTRPLTGVNAKKHAKRVKAGGEYSEVMISECPFATHPGLVVD